MAEEKEKNGYKYFWLLVVFSILLVMCLWYYNLLFGYGLKFDERGVFGDMFGAVNAVFSGLAFAGIIISLYLQRIDLKNQFEEIKKTNEEFKIQNDTMQVQKFENQYYKMIDLHKDNVNEIRIPFYENIITETQKKIQYDYSNIKENQPPSTRYFRELQGRTSFVDMVTELEYCFKAVIHISSYLKMKLKNDYFNLAYRVFFFGVYSENLNSFKSNEKFKNELINYLKDKQEDFKKDNNKFYKREVKIRYVPFQGHESILAHYYRHLFQTVKYVVLQNKIVPINYNEKRQYLRVLRAQMSNAEQLMLYYNYICGFGKNWDKLGGKYDFFTKYRMIHNMPVDRVKYVEKPRDHFKEFIDALKDKNDSLFEWGDIES